MAAAPASPKLYHITHVDNLSSILMDGGIWCDAQLIAKGRPTASIGMGDIKARRMALPVKCHPGDLVGGYVPFYFCPRSIMLYLIYMANHPNLAYRGGQGPILHLELDMNEVIAWAETQPTRWAFCLSNAGAAYTEFRARRDQLGEVDWASVFATDFRNSQVKEGKQAEFLVRNFVPWALVRRVAAHSDLVQKQVMRVLAGVARRPPVDVHPDWYY